MSLSKNRETIDEMDKIIIPAFIKRMEAAEEIGRYKRSQNLPVFDPKREREIIASRSKSAGNFENEVAELMGEIMRISRKRQSEIISPKKETLPQKAKAVYMGVPGSYGEEAANLIFGSDISSRKTFEEVFEAVAQNQAEFGVLPIENSSTGSITQIYDLLLKNDCFIVDEVNISVSHCLLGIKNANLSDVKEVYSHEQALFQCKEFIDEHKLKSKPYHNTAAAAEFVASLGDSSKAAIAKKSCAEIYGLDILAENINFGAKNKTRFIAISSKMKQEGKKISVLFTLANRAGSLLEALSIFAKHNINLVKIESRPIVDSDFEYRFFVDFMGSLSDNGVKNAITELQNESVDFKILGNY